MKNAKKTIKSINSDVIYSLTTIITTIIDTAGFVAATGIIMEGLTGSVSRLIVAIKHNKYN